MYSGSTRRISFLLLLPIVVFALPQIAYGSHEEKIPADKIKVFGWVHKDIPTIQIYPIMVDISEEDKQLYYGEIQYVIGLWERKMQELVPDGNWHINYFVGASAKADILLYTGWDRSGYYCKSKSPLLGTIYGDFDLSHNVETVFVTVLMGCIEKRFSNLEFELIVMHEIGHALGLGHSGNEEDVMYQHELKVRDPYVCIPNPGESCVLSWDSYLYVSNLTKRALVLLYGS